VIFRMGNVGKFVAMDLLERITTIGNSLSSNIAYMTKDETSRYKKFLELELRKIESSERKPQGKEIKVD
jgi:hypothetical protein